MKTVLFILAAYAVLTGYSSGLDQNAYKDSVQTIVYNSK